MPIKEKNKLSFFKKNGLLIVFGCLMFVTLGAQTFTGWFENNAERLEKQLTQQSLGEF